MTVELHPWEYTWREGGNFEPWKGGSVTRRKLLQFKKIAQRNGTVLIKEVVVHSLIFESAAAGHGNYARWDCINGWTTTIQQAKRNFPHGLHGVKRGS